MTGVRHGKITPLNAEYLSRRRGRGKLWRICICARAFSMLERVQDHRHGGQRLTGEHIIPAATEGEGEHEGAEVGEEDLLLLLLLLIQF